MSSKENRKNMPIKELRGRMTRAKKRAIKRAKRYYIGKNPSFKRGIVNGEFVSSYRMLLNYANDIQIHWDGDPDDKPSIVQSIEIKKLTKDLYIYCSSAARIVTRYLRCRMIQLNNLPPQL